MNPPFAYALCVSLLSLAACQKAATNPYISETVGSGPVQDSISATGEVSAVIKVNVGSQVSGTVAKLYVDFNSKVKKNDVLAELDPRLFIATLAKADASVAVAEAALDKAKVALMDAVRNLHRTQELFDKKMLAQADLDTADVTRAGAEAEVKSAQAMLLQARADRDAAATSLAFTKLRSPIDGIVIDRQVDVGQTVAATFQVATLFTIANDLHHVQILANVDEADVGKVNAGVPVQFTVDAYPNEQFAGRIREVRQAPASTTTTTSSTGTSTASSSGGVVTYAAVVDAENPDLKLRQGMTAQVTVIIAKRDSVVRVPNAALRYKPKSAGDTQRHADASGGPGRGGHVYRLEHDAPVAAKIRVGLSDGHYTEVLDGLQAGDSVVIGEVGRTNPAGGPRRGIF